MGPMHRYISVRGSRHDVWVALRKVGELVTEARTHSDTAHTATCRSSKCPGTGTWHLTLGHLTLGELALRAGATYLTRGEWEHLGRALVDVGVVFFSMGRYDDAERLCSGALAFVSSARNRFSAFQQIALARAASNAFEAAEQAAKKAEACAPDEAYVTAHLAWLRGDLAMQRCAWSEADRFLTEALRKLRGAAYDAVLVAAQLVRTKIRAGRGAEAADFARSLGWFEGALLRDPLDVNRLLHAALLDLVKAGEEARLSDDFLTPIVARIEDARSARIERLRRRLRP